MLAIHFLLYFLSIVNIPDFMAGRDDLISKLDSMNIYSEVHTFSDAPHSFWLFEPWFSNTIAYSVKFLNKVFQNE
jgi:pectinesterase